MDRKSLAIKWTLIILLFPLLPIIIPLSLIGVVIANKIAPEKGRLISQ